MNQVIPSEAGLKKEQIYIAVFTAAMKNEGAIETSKIYDIINDILRKNNNELSDLGKSSIRALINTTAVNEGYIYPFDKNNKGWRITPEAKELILLKNSETQTEIVINADTQQEETYISNTVRGALFEKYCLGLLKTVYPYYSWFHQGVQKNNERGLDLIAEKMGELKSEYKTIGVQVKNHKSSSTPTEKEWLKFMAGCFVRRIDKGIFITTGRLSSNQRREAGEGKILVIEGIEELNRIANEHNYELFNE